MLQPLQLEEVSVRCASEIAELRDFFTKAGVVLNTSESFSAVAARVRSDRAFSRDLTSHVWVFLHSRDKQISYSDLLGMLAIASAGPAFAASANEADAHFLLRFLMEARNAFDLPAAMPPSAQVVPLDALPAVAKPVARQVLQPDAAAKAAAFLTPVDEEEDAPLSFGMQEDESASRPLLWFAIAACLLLAMFGGFWLFHSSAANSGTPTATAAESAPITPPAEVAAVTNTESPSQRHEEVAPTRSGNPHRAPAPPPSRVELRPTPAASRAPIFLSTPAPANKPSSKPTPSTPLPAVARTAPSELRSSPHLLLRSASPSSGTGLAPSVVDVAPMASSGNNIPSGAAMQKATVRATSLGTMAANVTYSPAPAYPSAASALHVQGEVKLEAEVDPTGNVVSTRIISGPPLLQEAAADAVQRWRYRPYLYNDKPIGMNTTVVMDFQLP